MDKLRMVLCLAVTTIMVCFCMNTDAKALEDDKSEGNGYNSQCYYNMLDDEQKSIYNELYLKCDNFTSDCTDTNEYDDTLYKAFTLACPIKNKESIQNAYNALKWDNPQFFWLSDCLDFLYGKSGYDDDKIMVFCIKEYKNKSDRDEEKRIIEENITAFKKELDSKCFKYDIEKEKFVHNYIVDRAIPLSDFDMYSNGFGSSFGSSAGIMGNACKANERGYSVAFSLLLNYVGIKNVSVIGMDSDYNYHYWNVVCLDGKWYNTDIFNDDFNNKIVYDYFNQGLKSDKLSYVSDTESMYGFPVEKLPVVNNDNYVVPQPQKIVFENDLAESMSLNEGENICLSVEVPDDAYNVTYEWFKDGVSLGEKYNSSKLEISDAKTDNSGKYSVCAISHLLSNQEKTFSKECNLTIKKKVTENPPADNPVIVIPEKKPPVQNPPQQKPSVVSQPDNTKPSADKDKKPQEVNTVNEKTITDKISIDFNVDKSGIASADYIVDKDNLNKEQKSKLDSLNLSELKSEKEKIEKAIKSVTVVSSGNTEMYGDKIFKDSVVLDFSYSTQFLFPVNVTLNFNSKSFNSTLYYVYYLNEGTGKPEYCGTAQSNGSNSITLTLSHCSKYLLTQSPPENKHNDIINSTVYTKSENPHTSDKSNVDYYIIALLSSICILIRKKL